MVAFQSRGHDDAVGGVRVKIYEVVGADSYFSVHGNFDQALIELLLPPPGDITFLMWLLTV